MIELKEGTLIFWGAPRCFPQWRWVSESGELSVDDFHTQLKGAVYRKRPQPSPSF